MDELIRQLTLLAITARQYYERELGQVPLNLPVDGKVKEEAPAKRTRKAKEETTAAVESAPTKEAEPVKAAVAEITEEESLTQALEVAKLLMKRFDKQIDGKAEGYHKARKLLVEHFKAGKIGDLVHAQRLQFVTLAKAELEKAPAGVA